MTRDEKIDYIFFRFMERGANYPFAKLRAQSDEVIDSLYEVEAKIEQRQKKDRAFEPELMVRQNGV